MKKIIVSLCILFGFFFLASFTNAESTTDVSDEFDYSIIIDRINYYQENNPDLTEDEIADLVADELFVQKKYFGIITKEEFWLIFNEWGINGFFSIYRIRNEVVAKTDELYPNAKNYNDDGDAFRHIYLTGRLCMAKSIDFSGKLMTAHESESEHPNETKMDLHNNSIGIRLYELFENKNISGDYADFIWHCVANGHFFNIIKFDNPDNFSKFVYTNIGKDNSLYASYSMTTLNDIYTSNISKNEFEWYKITSGNKSGKFRLYSSSVLDLKGELYDSRYANAKLINVSDDISVNDRDFSMEFDLKEGETLYLKIFGFDENVEGDYEIIFEVVELDMPKVTYERYNKKQHIRISGDSFTKEPHTIRRGSARYTNCIFCFELLDTVLDGPFMVTYSSYNNELLTLLDKQDELYILKNETTCDIGEDVK